MSLKRFIVRALCIATALLRIADLTSSLAGIDKGQFKDGFKDGSFASSSRQQAVQQQAVPQQAACSSSRGKRPLYCHRKREMDGLRNGGKQAETPLPAPLLDGVGWEGEGHDWN